jgi:hypothetical protein
METNPSASVARTASGWKTYLSAACFLLPSVFAWACACIFLFPKAHEIIEMSGADIVSLGWVWKHPLFLVAHGQTILYGMIFLFVVLEIVTGQWRRYRWVWINFGVWLMNTAVLFGLMTLLIAILMAAPSLAHNAVR